MFSSVTELSNRITRSIMSLKHFSGFVSIIAIFLSTATAGLTQRPSTGESWRELLRVGDLWIWIYSFECNLAKDYTVFG